MNKVYITGDTHWGIDEDKLFYIPADREDIVIVCGDCGALFNEKQLEHNLFEIGLLPYTLVFVDGNHDNFDLINSYPIVDFHGGKTHKILSNFYHLMRGEVFDFFGKTYFTFGGAASLDKHLRTPHKSWWEEEIPTQFEFDHGMQTLDLHNNKVDYIVSHTAPLEVVKQIVYYKQDHDHTLLKYFDMISQTVEFKDWFFGHFHQDIQLSKYHCLYNDVKLID